MSREARLGRVAIAGVGLIGGSLGLALRNGIAREVVGIGRRRESIDLAQRLGAIDRGTLDFQEGCKDAEIVVVATPVASVVDVVRVVAEAAPRAVITDVASTKAEICRSLAGIRTFVGGHPMAGSHKRGVQVARADLFKDAVAILCPTEQTDARAVSTVAAMWEAVGARIVALSPAEHDRMIAEASHLPHAAAACLVRTVSRDALRFAATGYADSTRVASGDPELWSQILLSNRFEVRRALEGLCHRLVELGDALLAQDAEAVKRILSEARDLRDAFTSPPQARSGE